MQRIVECIANFSEGRKAETVEALATALRSVPDVVLLDREMDADHHRSVLTFAGSPDAVAEAAFRVTQAATQRIDLRGHQGGHPRVGATDVVPFVPIRGVTMEECVAIARAVGERIGRELGIPIFLYQRAATQPVREHLENIRKGGLEGLGQRMASDPAWRPDFGPAGLHATAGATIVGARVPLIAYNVDLESRDLAAAKAIAKTVRFSSGGLPHVKALGLELASRGCVQVSMNLTNVDETPIHVAYDAVRREAEARGIRVARSEIVGLVPRSALLQSAEFFLRLEGFDRGQVLEDRLEAVLSQEPAVEAAALGASLTSFLNAVSAGTPTPGGGTVAAGAGAMAAGLGMMACHIAIQKNQKRPGPESTRLAKDLATTRDRLHQQRDRFAQLMQADAEAYSAVLAAYRRPKDAPDRVVAIAEALRQATDVPLETATLGVEVCSTLKGLLGQVTPSVGTDLQIGIIMAVGAVEGGLLNAMVNLKDMTNQDVTKNYGERIGGLKRSLEELKGL